MASLRDRTFEDLQSQELRALLKLTTSEAGRLTLTEENVVDILSPLLVASADYAGSLSEVDEGAEHAQTLWRIVRNLCVLPENQNRLTKSDVIRPLVRCLVCLHTAVEDSDARLAQLVVGGLQLLSNACTNHEHNQNLLWSVALEAKGQKNEGCILTSCRRHGAF